MLPKIFHAVVTFYYLYVLFGLSNIRKTVIVDESVRQVKDLYCRYMTNWNVGIQVIFFFSCFLYDILEKLGNKRWRTTLKKYQDYWFFTICLPNALFVFVAFWSLHLYDTRTIFAVPVNMVMPDWLNHAIHTSILPLVFVEMLLVYRKLPPLNRSMLIYATFIAIYGICLFETYWEKGVWIYPLFKYLNNLQIVLAAAAFFFTGILCFFVSRGIKLLIDSVAFSNRSNVVKKKVR